MKEVLRKLATATSWFSCLPTIRGYRVVARSVEISSSSPCNELTKIDSRQRELERISRLRLIVYIALPQNRILTIRITNSSRENTVRPRGRSGTAVAAASRVMSSSPKGTARISFTTA